MRRTAFTLIELLVTISIVVILVGLLMAGAKAVRDSSVKSRSEVIVGMVANGLAAAVAERKSLPIVPHPLAGTRATRLRFARGGIDPIRQEERHWAVRRTGWTGTSATGISGDFSASAAVDTAGLMLLGGERVHFTNATLARRRLLGNDVLAEPDNPIAHGAKRELLGVLGILNADIHQHVRAPSVHHAGEQRDPTTGAVSVIYANVGDVTASQSHLLVAPTMSPASANWHTDQEETVRRALESVWIELGKNQAIRRITTAPTILGARYCFDSSVNTTSSTWRPGHLRSGGTWRTVSLPGTSVIDGYGVELFISQARDGRVRVISAGKDGCLRVHPGTNGVVDTGISRAFTTFVDGDESTRFGGLSSDDGNGARDNISVGVEIDDYLDRITSVE